MSVLRYGDRALLVELDSPRDVPDFANAVVLQAHPAILSVVPAARTVLIEFDPRRVGVAELEGLIGDCTRQRAVTEPGPTPAVQIAVRYQGVDLAAVAAECGLSIESVIGRHLEAEYTVQFCGFSPGFGYLSGLDRALRLPRLASPRPDVPAGSVAIADEYTAIYPRSSPGGWRLIGHSDAVLFDLDRSPPALLVPGTRVRFVRQ
ncbi:MAG: 5-oxoprolinase subunit B family protein [Jatrophihabitans sp.]